MARQETHPLLNLYQIRSLFSFTRVHSMRYVVIKIFVCLKDECRLLFGYLFVAAYFAFKIAWLYWCDKDSRIGRGNLNMLMQAQFDRIRFKPTQEFGRTFLS